ncbi:Uncharacterised protein [Vibrio cholerae]|nr:Uncharacterised protein [Vibrio cholerae]
MVNSSKPDVLASKRPTEIRSFIYLCVVFSDVE